MSPIKSKVLFYQVSIYIAILFCFGNQLSVAQQNGPPKILPIATADSYPEGSSINLICTVSGGQRNGLHLSWIIQGHEADNQSIRRLAGDKLPENLSIRQDEADISILRVINATNVNSGDYSCFAKNPLGEDSTTVKILINVELKWKVAPRDSEIGLNQDLGLECQAFGTPEPRIEWIKHPLTTSSERNNNGSSFVVARGSLLKINRAQHRDSGIYECIARNGFDEKGELRRVFQIKVRATWSWGIRPSNH